MSRKSRKRSKESKKEWYSEKQYSRNEEIIEPGLKMYFEGKYLEIFMYAKNLKVVRAYKTRGYKGRVGKLRIWFEEPNLGEFLLKLHNKGKVGMLADYLGINRNVLYSYVENENVEKIQKLLNKQGNRIIKLSASLYKGDYYIFLVATKTHVTIKFREIKNILENRYDVVESGEIGRSNFWEVPLTYFDFDDDKFDTFARIVSGRNIKTRAIKVILILNTNGEEELNYSYTTIRHTENWKDRFLNALEDIENEAVKLADFVWNAREKQINEEIIDDVIETIVDRSPIRTESKLRKMENFLKKRVKKEKINNLFELAGRISYVSDNIRLAEITTENTPEFVKDQAYKILFRKKYQ